MHDHRGEGPSMNQLIFRIGLSVETISLYLLCCGLADAGETLTSDNLRRFWNGSPESLDEGLRILEQKKILRPHLSGGHDSAFYQLTGIEHWQT